MHAETFRFAAILFAAALSLSAQAAEIVVGQAAPFSGPLAPTGRHMQLGGQIYFDSVNAKGGINGAKIHLVSVDDEYKVEETVKLTKELLAKNKPVALFGIVGTGNVEALLKQGILAAADIPVVATRTGSYALHSPFNPYIFHIRASYRDEMEKIIEQLTLFGIKRIAVFYQDDPFGQDGLVGAEVAMKKRNLEPVAKGPYEKNTTKVEDAVKAIAAANPQAVVMSSNTAASAEFVRQFRATGNTAQLIAISVTDGPGVAKVIGPDLARGLGITQVMPNPYFVTSPLVKEFQENFLKYGPKDTEPNYTTLEGYIGAKVLVEGLRRAGPNPTRASLMRGLETLENLDLGGFKISYSKSNRSGSSFVELSLMGKSGKVRQ